MKHRSCISCHKDRPAVLFPKLKNGAYGKTCQLCVDTKVKDLEQLRTRGRRAQERRQRMLKANRKVSGPYARTRTRENGAETPIKELRE